MLRYQQLMCNASSSRNQCSIDLQHIVCGPRHVVSLVMASAAPAATAHPCTISSVHIDQLPGASLLPYLYTLYTQTALTLPLLPILITIPAHSSVPEGWSQFMLLGYYPANIMCT